MKGRRSVLVLLVPAALASGACTGVGPLAPTGAGLGVTADNPVLNAVGAQTRLQLQLPDGTTTDELGSVVWSSDNSFVASVDQAGTVTALHHGMATITASAGALSASTRITVDVDIASTATVRSDQTDSNSGNDTATVTITVRAN